MCGGGDGGGVGAGADIAAGNDATGGWGLPPGDTPGSHGGGSNVGTPPSGMDAAQPLFSKGEISNADVATALSSLPLPATAIISAMNYAGAFEGEGGDVTSAALGGPGADPIRPYYYGPPVAPVAPAAPSPPGVVEPIVRTDTTQSGPTPAEIDAANRLREERERAYAQQRANAEAESIKALSLRDTGTDSQLKESQPASARFIGLPPTIGQARHSWA